MKTKEQKLSGQIDRLLKKNKDDNDTVEQLIRSNAEISQKTDIQSRRDYRIREDVITSISSRVQRRSQLLKRHGQNLSVEKTVELL